MILQSARHSSHFKEAAELLIFVSSTLQIFFSHIPYPLIELSAFPTLQCCYFSRGVVFTSCKILFLYTQLKWALLPLNTRFLLNENIQL